MSPRKFAIGDIVRTVAPLTGNYDRDCIGVVGVVKGFDPPTWSAMIRRYEMNYYLVVSGESRYAAAEDCLRLVPGDTKLRQVVQWDWHSLNSPLKVQPAKDLEVTW